MPAASVMASGKLGAASRNPSALYLSLLAPHVDSLAGEQQQLAGLLLPRTQGSGVRETTRRLVSSPRQLVAGAAAPKTN